MSVAETGLHPEEQAMEATRSVLRTQWRREPIVRVDSPPGAGKTWLVERLAAQSYALLEERCMIAAQTNEQAFDITRRIAASFPSVPVTLFAKKKLPVPAAVSRLPNVNVIRKTSDLPDGRCVVVANAWKWSWVQPPYPVFDCLVVDEAFQLPDHRFMQIAGMAHRYVLVGDPGQIGTVVSCEIDRWQSSPSGPHVACPDALLARFPGLCRITLPVTRRLLHDTASVVQAAFYPHLPFAALARPRERTLGVKKAGGASPVNRAIDVAARGNSLVLVELPKRICGEVDTELADAMVQMCQQLLDRRTCVVERGAPKDLVPEMIGIVCAHVSQVGAVRERLPSGLSDVLVETADRFQGLERPVMLVHHPLSGRADISDFHLDAGRLCVMLSRHRIACFVFARAGIEEQLGRYVPKGNRVLGQERDVEYEGWKAQKIAVEVLRSGTVQSVN